MSPEEQKADSPPCSSVDYQREDTQAEEKLEVVEVAAEEEEVEEKVRDTEELVVADVEAVKEDDTFPEEKKEDKASSGVEGSNATQSPAEVEEATASR